MSDPNELEKTIEELEAEVIAALEEATDELEEANSDAMKPKANATPAEKGSKIEGERQDTGKPVVDPEQSDAPAKKVAAAAKEIGGDAQQKGEVPAEKSKGKIATSGGVPDKGKVGELKRKLAAGDESEHEGEELSEGPRTKDQHLEFFAGMKATDVKER